MGPKMTDGSEKRSKPRLLDSHLKNPIWLPGGPKMVDGVWKEVYPPSFEKKVAVLVVAIVPSKYVMMMIGIQT